MEWTFSPSMHVWPFSWVGMSRLCLTSYLACSSISYWAFNKDDINLCILFWLAFGYLTLWIRFSYVIEFICIICLKPIINSIEMCWWNFWFGHLCLAGLCNLLRLPFFCFLSGLDFPVVYALRPNCFCIIYYQYLYHTSNLLCWWYLLSSPWS